ncbi:MAG: DivIVA domain-containing protein [Clostridiaceae bacterium]|nr:DivIVA domain-containing protein [Clostridiaceae bacterium]
MFSPLDLEKIEFPKYFLGGYRKEDVDNIFAELVKDYEALYKENIALKDKIAVLDGLVQQYKSVEETMQNALMVAQGTGEEIIRQAKEKAEIIEKEAKIRAEGIAENLKKEIEELTRQKEALKNEIAKFNIKCQSLLQSQMDIIKELSTLQDA